LDRNAAEGCMGNGDRTTGTYCAESSVKSG